MPPRHAPLCPKPVIWLKQTKAFLDVYRLGLWSHGQLLSVGVLKRPGEITRVGLRTKRGLKGAVTRNRLKRQVRAILRPAQVPLKSALDVVVVIHPRALPATTAMLTEELRKLCKRVGCLS